MVFGIGGAFFPWPSAYYFARWAERRSVPADVEAARAVGIRSIQFSSTAKAIADLEALLARRGASHG